MISAIDCECDTILLCTLFDYSNIQKGFEWIFSLHEHCLSFRLYTNKFMIYYHRKFYWYEIKKNYRKKTKQTNWMTTSTIFNSLDITMRIGKIVVNKKEATTMRWMMTINCRSFVIATHQQKMIITMKWCHIMTILSIETPKSSNKNNLKKRHL